MTAEALEPGSLSVAQWRQDIIAGLVVGILALPVCLAAGVLVFSALGPNYVAEGAAAGLYGAIVAGSVAALFATSSFVITCPRGSPSLVLASLIAALLINPAFTGNPRLVIAAAALCAFLAGVWQILFGLFRVSDIIKFTPHPVFAGFVNGAAVLILKAQIFPFFIDSTDSALALPKHPLMLAFVVALALVGIFYQQLLKLLRLPSWASRVPGTIVVFMLGILVYHLAKWIEPALDLGPTIGKPDVGLSSPLLAVLTPGNLAQIGTIGGSILLISLVLALVASLESLMAFRAAQRVAEIRVHPIRDLAAQGLGNCATAIFAPIMSAATPTLLDANYRAGGRTRLSGIVAAAVILILGVLLSNALAAIPNAALSAVLATMGVMMFDKWSLRLAGQLVKRSSALGARRSWHDLIVVVAVMATTAMTTVVIGVIAGCLLSGIIFVVNMSRPVVRRKYSGSECFSKRIRSTEDVATLQKMGDRRAVLQLEGVLFFGNAENLATDVKTLFETADMIALDMRAITDIDASGTNILSELVRRSRQRGKLLLFCNVPAAQSSAMTELFDGPMAARAAIMPDLETTLEWMEEETLREHGDVRGQSDLLALEEIDFFDGVPDAELQELRGVLKLRAFKTGEPICREGDPGDKMWLLVKGSVSVRLSVGDHRGSRRITSLTRGTVFGEMALIEGAPRSASIVADEDVVCYELNGADFAMLLRDKPAIAATVMRNTARELARRLRRTSEDLRQATS
jgi:MFS superfamily sulfate permease-like transporter